VGKVALSAAALSDLERLTQFWLEQNPKWATQTTALILEALEILARHPAIGCPLNRRLRELVISRGETGYVASYFVHEPSGDVVVLRLRHQKERGR
jgi:plasmid stabilization system protein ParE